VNVDSRTVIVVVVVGVAVLVGVCVLYPEFGVGVAVGVGVGFGSAWFSRGRFDRWVLERKKRSLVRLREELRRLEVEVAKSSGVYR
jgi:hypothetical protein